LRYKWQQEIYLSAISGTGDPYVTIPHRYRPLPYGFARLLELCTGNWAFACTIYRWFFSWWFLWGACRLGRLFLPPGRALWLLVPVAVLYPLSVHYYWGQLTDPLSHFLFMLSLIWLLEDRPWPLAVSLALGVAAKETVVLLVVVYFACYWRIGLRAWARTIGLGVACVVGYLAVRLPQGWRPGLVDVNGLDQLMIGTNLGIGAPIANRIAPLWVHYLHPLLFVGPFLPSLVWGWQRIDPRLRVACAVLTPLLLASNICFGWLYESRNYMPLVPLLGTAILSIGPEPAKQQMDDRGHYAD
jgi:hypothetical protein